MAVRSFNGSSDYLQLGGSGASLADGPFTVCAYVNPQAVATGTLQAYVGPSRTTSNSVLAEMGIGASTADALTHTNYSDGSVAATPMEGVTGHWQVVAIHKDAGTGIACRMSCRQSSGTWDHLDSTVTIGTAPSDLWTLTNIGRRGTGTNFAQFYIAVAAVFTSNLADAALESMFSPNSTAAIAAQHPVALWEFNQASVSTAVADLVGSANETARSGTTVVTGSDPTWTFGLTARGGTDKIDLLRWL